MRLDRTRRALPVVSIVPLIDVLLILLVFFLVTSTFLDLDMIPLTSTDNGVSTAPAEAKRSVLIRITPSGEIVTGGQRITAGEIQLFLEGITNARLLILPSPQAELQSLVTVLDTAAAAGLSDVQVVRFGAGE